MGLIEIVDADIRFLSGNSATAHFFGISPESLRGRLISELGKSGAHPRI